MKHIHIENIFDYTEVKPPYFALANLSLNDDDSLSAFIPIQQPLDLEVGYISAAESGRHLAILGACSVAIFNPKKEKHYYLAYKAEFHNKFFQHNPEDLNYVYGVSKGHLINKRTAVSESSLFHPNGNVINILKTYYHVIAEKSFKKIYKNFKISTNFNESVNPYTMLFPIKNVCISEKNLTASLGAISPNSCAGHFPNFPALPVAILSSTLSRAAGYLLKNILNQHDLKYIICEVILKADNLAFAGEIVILEVEYLNSNTNGYVFCCKAIANLQKEVANLHIILSPINQYY